MSRFCTLISLSVLLTGCLRTVGSGPFMGECADYPDGTYTFGEVGIGTCLAGPTDLQFFDQGGTTYVGVSNANPYLDFEKGGLLVLDWQAIVDRIEDPNLLDEPSRIPVHTVASAALPIRNFMGEVGWIAHQDLLISPSRESVDAYDYVGRDDLFVTHFDPATGLRLWTSEADDGAGGTYPKGARDRLLLEDDPHAIAVDNCDSGDPLCERLAFVLNLTDHSVSVIQTDPPVASDDEALIVRKGIGYEASVVDLGFSDLDSSGSHAELAWWGLSEDPLDAKKLVTDLWTLTWIDATYRLFVPTADGISRWQSGGVDFVPGGLGIEFAPGSLPDQTVLSDPFVFLIEDLPVLQVASNGSIYEVPSTGLVGEWDDDFITRRASGPSGEYNAWLDAPCLLDTGDDVYLYHDGREAEGENGTIAVGVSFDGGSSYSLPTEPTLPIEGTSIDTLHASQVSLSSGVDAASVEDPFVFYDDFVNRYRMWFSVRDVNGDWALALAESEDGRTWGGDNKITELLSITLAGELEPLQGAAPVVARVNGRYVMWYSVYDDALGMWQPQGAWSYDGIRWNAPDGALIDPNEIEAYDPFLPPRPGLQYAPTAAFRVVGRDTGQLSGSARSGFTYLATTIGLQFRVANGHHVGTTAFDDDSSLGLGPSSAVIDGTEQYLYVTGIGDDGRSRIHRMTRADFGDEWLPEQSNLIPIPHQDGRNERDSGFVTARSPVVMAPGTVGNAQWLMVFGARLKTGVVAMRRASSADGIDWTVETENLVGDQGWNTAVRLPRTLEPTADGGCRLWYGAEDDGFFRIGAADATDCASGDFTPVEGDAEGAIIDVGKGGTFDDSGLKDPVVFTATDGVRRMLYSGFDGESWSIGVAYEGDDGVWVRARTFGTDPIASMWPLESTFASHSVDMPTLLALPDEVLGPDAIELWYAGRDGEEAAEGGRRRIGRAIGDHNGLFPTQRFPTALDELAFQSYRGPNEGGRTHIELAQIIDGFGTTGTGGTRVIHDAERGFLYVTTKLFNYIYVLDVRDDSGPGFVDSNFMDIEAFLVVDDIGSTTGMRDAVVVRANPGDPGLLYASAGQPDSVVVFDLSLLVDNNTKELINGAAIASLPGRSVVDDEGVPNFAIISGAGMALTQDNKLLVTQFRSNSIYVYDLGRGAYGELAKTIPFVGENPHVIRVSPDGQFALVANYLGEVGDGDEVHSTLMVLDLRPAESTYLEPIAWIVNL